MKTLIKNISSLVTIASKGKKKLCGIEMNEISEIKDGSVLFDEKILWIGKTSEVDNIISVEQPEQVIDLRNKTVIPGFVDSHTHIVFAGNRSDEFARRLRGATYEEIANAGGGIQTTVRATRNASIEELVQNASKIAENAIAHGTTTLEVKSGYGLTIESELKQLKAIKKLAETMPIRIVPTFLGAHDFPPEYKNNKDKYVDIICNEMIPQVAEEKLAVYIDAFVDRGYYTLGQAEKIFSSALNYGLKIRVHADELANVEAASLAAKFNAVSADHLLFVSDNGIEELKKAGTIATLLPGTAYFIRMPYAPARKMIDNGLAIALATDCNPGSCFTENMQTILSLAVINMKMTAEEALSAATLNGAAALELSDICGSIEVGKQADFSILNTNSYTDLFYHFGINHVDEVWIAGRKVHKN
jgi:imidazolonepropionase